MPINMETIKARDRRGVRDRENQMRRALSAVYLAVEALSRRDRLAVLTEALRDATDAAADAPVPRDRIA
jgi:hypothetical protein